METQAQPPVRETILREPGDRNKNSFEAPPIQTFDDLPEELEGTSQGKIKKLFRKLSTAHSVYIKDCIGNVNNQLNAVSGDLFDKLDKKYGGMYRVLIHTFLTKQEEKIYTLELNYSAMKEILAEECYEFYKQLAELNKETPIKEADYMDSFNNMLITKMDSKHAELQKVIQDKATGTKDSESKKDSDGEEIEIPV